MCRLDTNDIRLFDMVFSVYNQKPHYVEFKTQTGQYYCVYKEDNELILLLHKHHVTDQYHVHYLVSDTTQALSEVLQHEKYILKRRKQHQKLCGDKKIEIIL
jgi:uncharacterized protein YbcV (DUF1398 family)